MHRKYYLKRTALMAFNIRRPHNQATGRGAAASHLRARHFTGAARVFVCSLQQVVPRERAGILARLLHQSRRLAAAAVWCRCLTVTSCKTC